MADRLQIKRDNASIWASVNPVLSDGEFGFERDTNLLKIGNGGATWNSLPYIPLTTSTDVLAMTARNITGATLLKGSVVYITGATGTKPTVALSQASTATTADKTFGVVKSDIPHNSEGTVVLQGMVSSLDTSGLSDGDFLYLSATVAGAFTNVQPTQPNHIVNLGVVTRAHPSLGAIEVRVQNGFDLEELHDVLITSKALNDSLVYDSASALWKNTPIGSAFAVSGEPLGGHRVVISSASSLYYASATNLAHKNRVVGLTLNAVTTGVLTTYLKEGLITEPSWTWNTSLPVYLADNGLLTQTPVNTTGFVMIVGMPASSTSLYISFQSPILL